MKMPVTEGEVAIAQAFLAEIEVLHKMLRKAASLIDDEESETSREWRRDYDEMVNGADHLKRLARGAEAVRRLKETT